MIAICRSIDLDYTEDVTKNGVTFSRFAGTRRLFANASDNADNWCFESYVPSGIANTSSCRYGSPAFVSFPHFYLADPYYLAQVDGLDPQKELHEFHVDLEPVNQSAIVYRLFKCGLIITY